MTWEEKSLLLRDLCARIPYHVKCELSGDGATLTEVLQFGGLGEFMYGRIEVKPYLRPLSSMTEEEKIVFNRFYSNWSTDKPYTEILLGEDVDWLNSNHFDYRGLIEKNLALDCTGMHIYD